MSEQAKSITYGLAKISIDEFFYVNLAQPVDMNIIEYNISPELDFRKDSDEIAIRFHVGVFENSQEKVQVGRIITNIVFHVMDLSSFATENGTFALPEQFMNAIAGIAFSTTRGLMIAKGAGTFIENLILPIYRPADLLEPFRAKE
jgi:hypothetical protein